MLNKERRYNTNRKSEDCPRDKTRTSIGRKEDGSYNGIETYYG